MNHHTTSIPMRLMCAVAAVLTGWLALSIAITGEFKSKFGLVELDLWARCLMTGVLGLMAVVAALVVVRK